MRCISQGICGATLILAASGAAAQSSLTMYGALDVFGQYLHNGNSGSFSEKSGGSSGSFFGFRGAEDLGGGLKTQFQLESGVNVNNGSFFADNTVLFYRQAWIGLTQPTYGSLSFGRQYEPTLWVTYQSDPFRANEVLSPLAAADLAGATDRSTLSTQYTAGRASNSIEYASPKIAGARFYAMYALAQTVAQPIPQQLGNILDLAANWESGGLYVGLAYQYQHAGTETIPNPATGGVLDLNLVGTEHYAAALAYRIGIVNLQANYVYTRAKDAPQGSLAALLDTAHSHSIVEAGATIQVTAQDTIEIAGIERNVRGAHDNTAGVQLGVDHLVSKRTGFYLRAGYLKNNGTATMSWPGNVVSSPATKQILAVVGMTHRF